MLGNIVGRKTCYAFGQVISNTWNTMIVFFATPTAHVRPCDTMFLQEFHFASLRQFFIIIPIPLNFSSSNFFQHYFKNCTVESEILKGTLCSFHRRDRHILVSPRKDPPFKRIRYKDSPFYWILLMSSASWSCCAAPCWSCRSFTWKHWLGRGGHQSKAWYWIWRARPSGVRSFRAIMFHMFRTFSFSNRCVVKKFPAAVWAFQSVWRRS